jgi:hypothetical protein
METFLIGFFMFGICLAVLGGYLAVVDNYFEQ